jgi:RNA polymerase sigma-70 factor, ECF subfamily
VRTILGVGGGYGDAAESLAEMLDEREHLLEIALWMFGSETTADQIVQETYRRWYALDQTERDDIPVPRAWLARVAGGICLELLADPDGSRSGQHPSITPRPEPRGEAHTSRSDPVRRLAPLPDQRPSPPPRRPVDLAIRDRHDRATCRFATACLAGDIAALRDILATDAVVISDGGGKVRAASRPLQGADEAARFVSALLSRPAGTVLTAESVNGRTGLVLRRGGEAVAVVSLSVAGTRITAVWIVLNPDKLTRWHQQPPPERRDR